MDWVLAGVYGTLAAVNFLRYGKSRNKEQLLIGWVAFFVAFICGLMAYYQW